MHILLTGSAGDVGSYVLEWLLVRKHQVTSVDVIPLPPAVLASLEKAGVAPPDHHVFDLTLAEPLEEIFANASPKVEGVIHLAAIPYPSPKWKPVDLFKNNAASSYNVLRLAVEAGVQRIVQASSVNAIGLSYTPPGHQRFHKLPIDETSPFAPEDEYALSKQVCEIQADSLVRLVPGTRIASLRLHMVKRTLLDAQLDSRGIDLWAWTSHDSAARACWLGLTSEGWEGAEAFYILADEIIWEGGLTQASRWKEGEEKPPQLGSLELLDANWKGRYGHLDEGWWEGRPRRAFWSCEKAKKLLGWSHDD